MSPLANPRLFAGATLVAMALCAPGRATAANLEQADPQPVLLAAPTQGGAEVVDNGGASRFATSATQLYWSNRPYVGPRLDAALDVPGAPHATNGTATADALAAPEQVDTLKRWPLGGGRVALLAEGSMDHSTLFADDQGVYQYSVAHGGIVLRPNADPRSQILLALTSPPTGFTTNYSTNMMYWLAGGKLWFGGRSAFNDPPKQDMANSGANAHDLIYGGDGYLYWFGDNMLFKVYGWCLFGGSACVRDVMATEDGAGLTWLPVSGAQLGSSIDLHWIGAGVLRGYRCNSRTLPVVCGPTTTQNPQAGASILSVGGLAGSSNRLFWFEFDGRGPVELRRQTFAGPFGVSGADTVAGGAGHPIAVAPTDAVAAGGFVFFSGTTGGVEKVFKLRLDAPPILPDIEAIERTVGFHNRAPICAVFIKVRTRNTAALFTPNHWFAIEMAERLLPAPEVWTFTQSEDIAELEARFGIPPWKYGPYEPADDSWKMILSLWARDQFSDDPDQCDDARSRTHYIGIVDPGESGSNGSGRLGGDQLWIRLPPVNPMQDWRTDRAVTLAHELGHNYGRRHVDCPAGDPDDVGGYPYDPCNTDHDDGHGRHFGLTFNNALGAFEIIPPTAAGDLMSYAHRASPPKPRWISDFTWGGLLNEMPVRGLWLADGIDPGLPDRGAPRPAVARADTVGARAPARSASPAALDVLANAHAVVHITGSFDPFDPSLTTLLPAWVWPTDSASPGVVAKWQRAAAPAWRSSGAAPSGWRPGTRPPATGGEDLAERAARAAALAELHVQLLGVDGAVLADRTVTPFEAGDAGGSTQPFAMTIPAPDDQVAHIVLMGGSTELARISPGPTAPSVAVVAPAGEAVVPTTLELAWTASDDDGDPLLATLQYSPDDGATWRTIAAGVPHLAAGETARLQIDDMSGLPASNAARIRVAVTDGYHTTLAISEAFVVADGGPKPTILAPMPGAVLPSPGVVTLVGAAVDAEDGRVADAGLGWSVQGPMTAPATGAGGSLALAGLGAGHYTAALTATDAGGHTGRAESSFTVAPLAIPDIPTPAHDGGCDDDAYAGAARLPMAPYADGRSATVLVGRASGMLWTCFADLQQAHGTSSMSFVAVRVDTVLDRGTAPQPDDREFIVFEDGMPLSKRGNGSTLVDAPASGHVGQVQAAGGTWSAEVSIPGWQMGSFLNNIGFNVDHYAVSAPTAAHPWPQRSHWSRPDTYGEAAFGLRPLLASIEPAEATVGDGPLVLTLRGTDLGAGLAADWAGQPLSTTVGSTMTLVADVPARPPPPRTAPSSRSSIPTTTRWPAPWTWRWPTQSPAAAPRSPGRWRSEPRRSRRLPRSQRPRRRPSRPARVNPRPHRRRAQRRTQAQRRRPPRARSRRRRPCRRCRETRRRWRRGGRSTSRERSGREG